jgi:glycosyltransferase involved in cell wall biosynthesis
MMRIGILAEGFAEWQGGIDFLRMICDCLPLGFPSQPPKLGLLFPRRPALMAAHQMVLDWWGGAHPWPELLRRQIDRSTVARVARVARTIGGNLPVLVYRDDDELDAMARRQGIDCLLPCFRPLLPSVRTPWVGYLYDFQHRHLPDHFSAEVRATRDRDFAAMASQARQVIVNSRDVADDCLRFLGGRGAKFVPLPFGAAPMPEWLSDQPAALAKYALPRRYFLVSNQFWAHKNHRLVFQALAHLARAGQAEDVAVVCTGSTKDLRDSDYFPSLLRLLDEVGIADSVRILGLIPKRDQIEIMKRALAVIQPTLFEGGPGGGAVYDAVSLAVPALVSDIAVNRELLGQGFRVRFFSPSDAPALASLMLDCIRAPAPARKDAATLIAEGRRRRQAVGRVLVETLKAVEVRQ